MNKLKVIAFDEAGRARVSLRKNLPKSKPISVYRVRPSRPVAVIEEGIAFFSPYQAYIFWACDVDWDWERFDKGYAEKLPTTPEDAVKHAQATLLTTIERHDEQRRIYEVYARELGLELDGGVWLEVKRDAPASEDESWTVQPIGQREPAGRGITFEIAFAEFKAEYARQVQAPLRIAGILQSALLPPAAPEGLYVIANLSRFVGNAVLFWGPDRGGYFTDLDKIGLYSEEEARRITNQRNERRDRALLAAHVFARGSRYLHADEVGNCGGLPIQVKGD